MVEPRAGSNDPSDPNIVTYVPASGSVASAAPSPLTINYTTTPPSVGGDGTNLSRGPRAAPRPSRSSPAQSGGSTQAPLSAMPLSSFPLGVRFTAQLPQYLKADFSGLLAADGLKIEGNAEMAGLSFSSRFTAN